MIKIKEMSDGITGRIILEGDLDNCDYCDAVRKISQIIHNYDIIEITSVQDETIDLWLLHLLISLNHPNKTLEIIGSLQLDTKQVFHQTNYDKALYYDLLSN
jgi:hypothetical protein